MKEFYWEAKARNLPIPHILGLSASPIVKSNVSTLDQLESTLDSVCRSPTRHRDELLANSNRPSLFSVTYAPQPLHRAEYTESMSKIHTAREVAKRNIQDDPYVRHLQTDVHTQNNPRSKEMLEAAVMKHKTYVQKQLRALCMRSVEMGTELGSWAADWVRIL